MGRKLNLSHLSEEECERILNVVKKDFDLRERERERLGKVECELEESKATEQVRTNQRQYNNKHCIRCCSAFNFLFNKKLKCDECQFFVCRDCASWDSHQKTWICTVCLRQRELKDQSCEWFYDHVRHRFKRFGGAKVVRSLYKRRVESDSENDSGYDPSTSVCSRDGNDQKSKFLKGSAGAENINSNEIRQHIETLVESIVGDALDNAHIDKIYHHPEYDRMFDTYQGRLTEAVTRLYCSLDISINCNSKSNNLTPTSAHAELKKIICEIVDEASRLPCFQDSGNASASSSSISHEDDEDLQDNLDDDLCSYEHILASAILNKVIEQYQRRNKMTDDAGTDTDDLQQSTETVVNNENDDGSRSENGNDEARSSKETRHVGIQSDGPSERDTDNLNPETSSNDGSYEEDFSWAENMGEKQPPVAYVIEEHIEEITETYDSDDCISEERRYSDGPPVVREPLIAKTLVANEVTVPELDYLYSGLDFVKTHKVPFPEFGIDLVESDGNSECESPSSTMRTPIDSWEENWLFRKQKMVARSGRIGHLKLGRYEDPICMLIPNPSEDVPARIGSLDIDQLSDLSDHNSVGSLEFTSSDGDSYNDGIASPELQKLTDDIVTEFSQKDLEYTVDYYKASDKLHRPVEPSISIISKRDAECDDDSSVRNHRPVGSSSSVDSNKSSSSSPQKDVEYTVDSYKSSDKLHLPIVKKKKKKNAKADEKDFGKYPMESEHKERNRGNDAENSQESIIAVRKTSLSIPAFIPSGDRKSSSRDPRFIVKPESVNVHAGKIARVCAQVDGFKPVDIAWFHNGRLLNDGGCFQVYWSGDRKFCLDVFDTVVGDTGIYSCVAFNNSAECWTDFNIKVKSSSRADNKPEFITELENQTASERKSVRLSCKVTGYPEPQVVFYLQNKRLRNNEKYNIDNLGYGDWTIEVKSTSLSDGGIMTAVAKNKVGEIKSSAILNVEESLSADDLRSITKRVNQTQENIERETKLLLDTAQQLNELSEQINLVDDNVHRVETLVVQRTWEERQNQIQRDALHQHFSQQVAAGALRRTTGRALDVIDRTNRNKEATLRKFGNDDLPSLSYSTPPKPGTIAEREHKKWLEAAVSMPNNPYSRENLVKRIDTRNPSRRLPGGTLNGAGDENHDVQVSDDDPRKIDCGLKKIETERYQRDYYVNETPKPAKRTKNVEAPKPMPRKRIGVQRHDDETPMIPKSDDPTADGNQNVTARTNDKLNSVEEKVYLSAGKVYSLEDRIKQLELKVENVDDSTNPSQIADLEDQVALAVAQVECNDRHVSNVEKEIARIRREVVEESRSARHDQNLNVVADDDRQTLVDNNCNVVVVDEIPTLPSVKKLATRFKSTNDDGVRIKQSKKKKEKIPEKDVIVVERDSDHTKTSSAKNNTNYKVHSLTARMVSKEFREQVRQKPINRTCIVPNGDEMYVLSSPGSNDSADSQFGDGVQHGYTSDESTTSSNSFTRNDKPKRKTNVRSLLSRTSYWEKRAEQQLLSDCSVGEEFPSIDRVPK